MPDPLSLLRFVALVVFIGLVAVGLWLLDVAWWVVPPVMAGALLIAWTIEWVAWRGSTTSSVVRESAMPLAPPVPVEETPRVDTLAPSPPLEAEARAPEPTPPPPPLEPTPEPPSVPEPDTAPPEPEPPAPPLEPEPPARPEPPSPAEPTPPPPTPEPEPPAPPAPVAAGRVATGPKRPRRFRLRSVPAPRPDQTGPTRPDQAAPPSPPLPPAPEPQSVLEFRPRTIQPREWNLWDLERIAREEAAENPERRDEWSYLFLNLRQFATADGSLPAEFDGLVRESFGRLLERPRGV